MNNYDVIIVGAGHAGCEAALAASRMGANALLLTPNIDFVASMSCNPAIGGLGKGNLVKDLDALGGEIGNNADKSAIQFQILNSKKGVGAQSSRAQADKLLYSNNMREVLFSVSNLSIRQSQVSDLIVENGEVRGVRTIYEESFFAPKVIICTGTFLNGKIYIGEVTFPAGRMFEKPSIKLAESLKKYNFHPMRLKTGTPARLDKRSIDFSKLSVYEIDSPKIPFSYENEAFSLPQIKCYLTYTNERTKAIVQENIARSIYYNSKDKGVGPRYCPSMEDKIARFKDKERHQIVLEPEGLNSNSIYPNGFSTSLPVDAQIAAYRTIEGLEKCEFIRPAYAIEYEAYDPRNLHKSYETKALRGLYFAGQINGTSGYEEAAAQGFMAGVNAVLSLDRKDPFILERDESYIGVLTDDIVTKGIDDPYRMFSSRAEYRLLLRENSAEYRLLDYGFKFGLISNDRYERFKKEKDIVERAVIESEKQVLALKYYRERLKEHGVDIDRGITVADILKRPECNYDILKKCGVELAPKEARSFKSERIYERISREIETRIKYKGYIEIENRKAEASSKIEHRLIPQGFDYRKVSGLRNEYIEKLERVQPSSLGQALRIPGMSQSAVNIIDIYIKKQNR